MYYRAQYRNEARRQGLLGQWAAWVQANMKAKIAGRREECQRANGFAAFQLAKLGGVLRAHYATFWRSLLQKPQGRATGRRVILRILRDLAEPVDRRARFA